LPPTTTAYKIKGCWIQYTGGDRGSYDESKKLYQVAGTELLANGHDKYAAILQLEHQPPVVIGGVKIELITPDRKVFGTLTQRWEAGGLGFFGQTLNWTWPSGRYFWQNPEITTTQATGWSFAWTFPDGQTCGWSFTVV
jgi:hypothetical protein